MSHTPGPWRVDTKYTRVTIVAESGLGVAFMSQTTAVGNATFDDARLIAAAPDLLAVVRQLASMHLTAKANDYDSLVGAARVALAKIEGP